MMLYFRKKLCVRYVIIPGQCTFYLLTFTLFRMGFFGAAHGWGGGQKGPTSLKSVTHILQ